MARFHTSDGKFVGWNRLPHGFISFYQAMDRRLTGHIPRKPWIPFAAAAALKNILSSQSIVWEIGAGYSTLWLADRVAHVTSIEAAREWFDILSSIIAKERLKNIDLRFEWVAERMASFESADDCSLDLLFVDGGPRGNCLENGFAKVKHGGYIYLDNWDTKHFWDPARDFPERNAHQISEITSFIDYVPAQVGVYEGLLLKKA